MESVITDHIDNLHEAFASKYGLSIAVDLLPVCHYSSKENMWICAVQQLNLDPADVLNQQYHLVEQKFIRPFDGSDHMRAILKTVAFVGRERIISSIVHESEK